VHAELKRLGDLEVRDDKSLRARPPIPAATPVAPQGLQVLTIDVGGSKVKVKCSGGDEVRKAASGPRMTAETMVATVKAITDDWIFDAISIGFPGLVIRGRIEREPYKLGSGWIGLDYADAFGKPTKIINDAAMQALGAYDEGRMLFLGLGTGLGSSLILDGVVHPLQLGHLYGKKGRRYEDYAGKKGQKRLGKPRWRKAVTRMIADLSLALLPDYVVLGGGEAKEMKSLPPNCRRGSNADAFEGGVRMWTDPRLAASASDLDPSVHILDSLSEA
jgi:polyphosphate glucokinase